ncbi:hypothetical protein QTL97_01395 [Sporosarcina thermotolerans]|uniref:Aminoglycoside phosphotransferase domain-containing protein n=1 Tax=Sporosarcina thermotolerans TaxID=633404 RepID=A0AAW9A3H1_9BACL|nr:hypothetical protein [Sporosarcina thermotolerans]MDW0115591.1 hypothetical protein [Sporosarcina thermotolerans]WHT47110.1 hypothetical protein QNH10_12550 [Sporosarcina thermotolerans]
MNIGLETINEVLALYTIKGQISNIHNFIHYYDEKNAEVKIICKVEFTDRNPVVVKFVKEKEHPSHIIESQSLFSEYLRDHGILTPRRYVSEGRYCQNYKLHHLDVAVTVEDYLGEEIKAIDYNLAYKLGQLMGKIHKISEKGNCLIGNSTIFNLVGYNEVSGYNAFRELGEAGAIDTVMYWKIIELYTKKLEKVKLSWGKLPRFATQGDISINNLSYIEGNIGIFDYNIAGDETLVGDMVLEGLLTACEMDLADGLTDNDRKELFKTYYKGYITARPLSDDENAVLSDVYSISSALWFTKIKYNDSSLEKLVEREEHDKVRRLLEEIYVRLHEDDHEILADKGE